MDPLRWSVGWHVHVIPRPTTCSIQSAQFGCTVSSSKILIRQGTSKIVQVHIFLLRSSSNVAAVPVLSPCWSTATWWIFQLAKLVCFFNSLGVKSWNILISASKNPHSYWESPYFCMMVSSMCLFIQTCSNIWDTPYLIFGAWLGQAPIVRLHFCWSWIRLLIKICWYVVSCHVEVLHSLWWKSAFLMLEHPQLFLGQFPKLGGCGNASNLSFRWLKYANITQN